MTYDEARKEFCSAAHYLRWGIKDDESRLPLDEVVQRSEDFAQAEKDNYCGADARRALDRFYAAQKAYEAAKETLHV